MFTKNFGRVSFALDKDTVVDVPDLTRFSGIAAKYKNDPSYCLAYQIKEGERIDQIATKIYGTPDRWFLIALFNNMTDMINEWPMTDAEFKSAMIKTYGSAVPIKIHHYEDAYGVIMDPLATAIFYGISADEAVSKVGLKPVTIFDYEFKKNEAKKKIKILDPDRVGVIEDAMRKEYYDV